MSPSISVSIRLGRHEVEWLTDVVDPRLGPLNMKAAGDTRSMLGIEPCINEFGFDPKLEVLDREWEDVGSAQCS
jgi:hypothetical protein